MMHRKTFFDQHADTWDMHQRNDSDEIIRALLDKVRITVGSCVLDAGCGTGILFPFLKEKCGDKGVIFGMDISEKMINKAYKKYGDAYYYELGSIEDTAFSDEMFDVVVCFSMFPHVVHKAKAFREIHRILTPNGVVAILHSESRAAINALHHRIGGSVKNDVLPDDKTMKRLCNVAGFCNVRIEDGDKRYYAVARKAWVNQ